MSFCVCGVICGGAVGGVVVPNPGASSHPTSSWIPQVASCNSQFLSRVLLLLRVLMIVIRRNKATMSRPAASRFGVVSSEVKSVPSSEFVDSSGIVSPIGSTWIVFTSARTPFSS